MNECLQHRHPLFEWSRCAHFGDVTLGEFYSKALGNRYLLRERRDGLRLEQTYLPPDSWDEAEMDLLRDSGGGA